MADCRHHFLLLPLSAAIGLHLTIAAALLWLTAYSPLSPPRPLEVSLIEVEVLRLHNPVVPPSPNPPHTNPAMRRARPLAATPIILHTDTPIAESTPPAPPPPATEQAPDAPTTSFMKPDTSIQILTKETKETIEPPQYNSAYLSNPPPSYPPLAKRLGIEGRAMIRVMVDPSGKPEQIELAQSSGSTVLDRAALTAVRQWTFIPARQGTEAVSAWVKVPIRFHLQK